MAKKMWAGRFEKATDKEVNDYNSSLPFDCKMYSQDIEGSIAHSQMLAKQGVISEKDAEDMMTISQTEPNEYETEDYEPTGQQDEGVDDSTDEDEQYLQEVVDMLDELLEEIDNG